MNKKIFSLCIFVFALAVGAGTDAFADGRTSVFGKIDRSSSKKTTSPERKKKSAPKPEPVDDVQEESDPETLAAIKATYEDECESNARRLGEMREKMNHEIVAFLDNWVKVFTKKMQLDEAKATNALKEEFERSRSLSDGSKRAPAVEKIVRECRKRLAEMEAREKNVRVFTNKKYIRLADEEIRALAANSDFEGVMKIKDFRDSLEAEIKNPSAAKGNLFAQKTRTVNLGNGVRIDLVCIPAGTFVMGYPNASGEIGHAISQTEKHIEKPFFLGEYEVTQAQWQVVMGTNPAHFKNDKHPVEMICWAEAMEFCAKLTERERAAKRISENMKYTLPTEEQWEYACRAGTTTRYFFGEDASKREDYAWYKKNSGGKTHPVGQKKSNRYGLHDMYGNVWELTDNGAIRGGAFAHEAEINSFCRWQFGERGKNTEKTNDIGFRVALVEE